MMMRVLVARVHLGIPIPFWVSSDVRDWRDWPRMCRLPFRQYVVMAVCMEEKLFCIDLRAVVLVRLSLMVAVIEIFWNQIFGRDHEIYFVQSF